VNKYILSAKIFIFLIFCQIIEVPRKVPKLKDEAVPTTFPNLPKYLSKQTTAERKDPEIRRLEWSLNEEAKVSEILKSRHYLKLPLINSRTTSALDSVQGRKVANFNYQL